jgi:ABC-2 type transport system ATP-binding protein
VRAVRTREGVASLTVAELHRTLPALMGLFERRGVTLASLTTHHATLEDVFVSLTGRHIRDD